MKTNEGYKEKVESALKKFLEQKLKEDKEYSKTIKELIENILEFNLRSAKRVRPLITIFTYKCFKDDDKIIPASIFIELMQAYLIIHDDIIDNGDIRRGGLAFHRLYSKKYGDEFGRNIAILAGNLCSAYPYDCIMNSDFDKEKKLQVINLINWIDKRENYGETLDILPGFANLTEEEVWKIYELKTGTYTFQGPVKAGYILGEADENSRIKLDKYAYSMGLAFQIQDDLVGLFGDPEKTGKPSDSDIKEGKKTLMIAKALEFCESKDKEFLIKEYGNKNVSEKSINRIREIVDSCGSREYCMKKLNELAKKSKDAISNLDLRAEGKNYLLEIADYIASLPEANCY